MSVRMLVTECFDGNHTECKGYNGPADNPNFVCDCDCHRKQIHDDSTCPCHEFSAKSPSETYYGHPRLDTGQNNFLVPEAENASSSLLAQNSPISAPTFEQEWQDAPRWATRATEEISANYWFIRGQHAKEVELLAGMNHDLREMIRVAREKVIR